MTALLDRTRHAFDLGGFAPHNTTFCVSVEATDSVGLVSARASSDCATVDATPPTMVHVGGGLGKGVHLAAQSYMDLAFANAQVEDDLSAVDAIEWCLSSGPNASGHHHCDITPPTFAPPLERLPSADSRLGIGDLTLSAGDEIFFGARARTEVGLWSGWLWSEPTTVGSMQAELTPGEVAEILLDVSISNYTALCVDESNEALGDGDTAASTLEWEVPANASANASLGFQLDAVAATRRRRSWATRRRRGCGRRRTRSRSTCSPAAARCSARWRSTSSPGMTPRGCSTVLSLTRSAPKESSTARCPTSGCSTPTVDRRCAPANRAGRLRTRRRAPTSSTRFRCAPAASRRRAGGGGASATSRRRCSSSSRRRPPPSPCGATAGRQRRMRPRPPSTAPWRRA